MRKILLSALLATGLMAGLVQAQAIQLKLTLDVNDLNNPDCWLNQGVVNNNKVYIHSGLCTSNAQLCTDSICVSGPNSVWQHVIGNWGIDDGIGLMTYEGGLRWSITMIPTTYYNTPGATPYTIGLVFRNDDGMLTAKDGACNDIFIKNIQGNPTVVGCDGLPFGPLAVEKTVLAGVSDPSYLGGLVVSPRPFRDQVNIDYALTKKASHFSVRIFSGTGQEVIRLASGSQVPGSHRLTWDGRDVAGREVGNGMYFMVMADGDKLIANEKLLLMR